jgi:hypothetical protein
MPSLNLKNITISERTTINGETYFLIKDNDQDQVYFCFQNNLKDSWSELVNNWREIKEVEIEYKENGGYKQVIGLDSQLEGEIFI